MDDEGSSVVPAFEDISISPLLEVRTAGEWTEMHYIARDLEPGASLTPVVYYSFFVDELVTK